jgi:hypothetical protein
MSLINNPNIKIPEHDGYKYLRYDWAVLSDSLSSLDMVEVEVCNLLVNHIVDGGFWSRIPVQVPQGFCRNWNKERLMLALFMIDR